MAQDIKFISNRISYKKSQDELTVIITGKVDRSKETILLTWLLAWTICGIIIITQLFLEYSKEEKLYFIIFLAFWLFFEVKILKVFRWRKWGKEYLRLAEGKLTIKKSVSEYAKAEEYFLENIKKLRKAEKSKTNFLQSLETSFWALGDDTLSFDYQGKEIKFGMQLDEKEVNALLKILSSFLIG